MRQSTYPTIGLLLLWAVSGCAQRTCQQTPHGTSTLQTVADTTPTTSSPGIVEPGWASLPSFDRLDAALGREPAPTAYRAISAEQCQCGAAANAALGNALDAECRLIRTTRVDRHGRLASHDALLADVLAARAVEERNKAAGTALELFYRLAEVGLQRDVLLRSLQEADEAIANYGQLQQRGIALPSDDTALQRQRFDLLNRQVQLETAAQQIEGQLCRLLAVPSDGSAPWTPVADLTVTVAPQDAAAAVAQGCATRPDLAVLRLLYENLDGDTLPAVRSAMQSTGGLLGAAPAAGHKLRKAAQQTQLDCEQQTRQLQLCLLWNDQARAAEEEIRQAVREVESRLRQAALAKHQWDRWQEHVRGLRDKQTTEKATTFDVSAAQLQALQAERDAVSALAAWKIAEVKLNQAQGLLACQCGFRLPPSCGCQCAPPQGDASANH